MGLTRADLIGDMSDQERADRQFWIDRTSSNDLWAKKIFNKVGILFTGHQANRPYMKASLETHAKLGLWITLAYDNYVDPAYEEVDHTRFLPPADMMKHIDMFVMPHHQCWGGVLYPWFWLLKWGIDSMSQFEYIYCTNSDFIIEKPEGFPALLEHMGDRDIMSYGPNEENSVSTCFIAKTSAIKKIVKHFQDHFIPWDVYEKYTMEFGNAEARFARAIRENNLTIAPVNDPFNEQMHKPGYGTWYDLIGYRHIHGEHNYAYRYKGIPPHYKYLDQRFMGDEYRMIKEYYDQGEDIKLLENWWAK